MTVDPNGVTIGSTTISWDQFNGMAPTDQKTVLTQAGVNPARQDALLHALQGTEIEQYKQYQADQAGTSHKKQGLLGKIGGAIENNVAGLFHPHPAFDQQSSNDFAKSLGGNTDKSIASMQQDTGFSTVLSEVQGDAARKAIQGAASTAAGATDPSKVYPAYTPEALNEYTKNFVEPINQQMAGLINGDMNQWQSAVGQIAKATGQQGSPLTQLMQQNANSMGPLLKLLGNATNQAAYDAPYYNMVNNAVGQAATIGARQQALGTAAQNIYQYGLIDPSVAALGQQSGAGALGSTGSSSILQTLLQAPTAGVNTALPGAKAGTTTP